MCPLRSLLHVWFAPCGTPAQNRLHAKQLGRILMYVGRRSADVWEAEASGMDVDQAPQLGAESAQRPGPAVGCSLLCDGLARSPLMRPTRHVADAELSRTAICFVLLHGL